ncbi:cytochrome c [Desulfolithobacter dissulfuricans]|uniref:Cytochrome c n=1 Tax=Desulfolithobacter dissulfuricans TaxID=2795293 RepID=A0A915TZR1_9BACT|nr:cytochrome c3 family protein [Desulfolithobacter dissulfuricans]BCO08304.1 cytochrome c [Desulfolithobacter dissulfuricans]
MNATGRFTLPGLLLFLLLGCTAPPAHGAGNLTRNSARECAICHFRWIDQFVQGYGTVLTPLETEDVAGTELMCLSCHDGSTDDSRKKVWILDRHKTGIIPSDKVKIPKLFPLSHDGKIVCATCHSAHGVPTDTSIERTIFLRISEKESIMCEMCHVGKTDTSHNHPLHSGDRPLPEAIFKAGAVPSDRDPRQVICESCHTAHGGVERNLLLPASDSTLCITCHEKRIDPKESPRTSHENHPVRVVMKEDRLPRGQVTFTGRDNSVQCLSCHLIHREKKPGQPLPPKSGPTRYDYILIQPESDSSLCLLCHREKASGPGGSTSTGTNHPINKSFKQPPGTTRYYQGPGHTLQCRTCHRPHQAAPGSRGLVLPEKTVCSSCHTSEAMVVATDHDLRITAPKSQNRLKQTPERAGVCSPCHVPHNGGGRYLWARPTGKQGPDSALCQDCHRQGREAGKKTIGKVTHPVDVVFKRKVDLPLATGDDNIGRIQCHTCHNPHQWRPGDPAPGTGHNEEGDASSSFLRKTSGADPSLCRTCHEKESFVADTDHDLHLTAPKAKNSAGRTVTQDGICSPCHVVHNGTGPRLWARTLPGNPSRSDLCRSCHRTGGVAKAKTTGKNSHPVSVPVEEKVNLPLSGQGKNGNNMECETCHNPHQWSGDQATTGPGRKVEGTEATSFLRIPNLEKPLLCRECHRREYLVTGTDHDLRYTAPDSKNARGQKAVSGSACAPCHGIHNAANRVVLWNAPLMKGRKGDDFMEKACYGCHNPRGAGKEKLVQVGSHPRRIYFGYRLPYSSTLLDDPSSPDGIPLFTGDGRTAVTGEISCPTCHDPHVWQAGQSRPGNGRNIEGSPVNSFLRREVRKKLCYECHGIDTLFLYRYYHVTKERQKIKGHYSPGFPLNP